jgi:hypothetical protein
MCCNHPAVEACSGKKIREKLTIFCIDNFCREILYLCCENNKMPQSENDSNIVTNI